MEILVRNVGSAAFTVEAGVDRPDLFEVDIGGCVGRRLDPDGEGCRITVTHEDGTGSAILEFTLLSTAGEVIGDDQVLLVVGN